MKIQGAAQVRWVLDQKAHGSETTVTDEFDDEPAAREAFEESYRDRSVERARLVMRTDIEVATHFKSKRP